MNFEIIEYNLNEKIKKTLFILIYFIILLIFIFRDKESFLKWVLITDILLWIIFQWFIKTYKVTGKLIFKSNDEIIIKNKESELKLNLKELSDLFFYYGGYQGEVYEANIFISGSWVRDGTKNYIIINGNNKIQLLIKSKKGFDFINVFILKLSELGVNVELHNNIHKLFFRS